jgi:hypothetical protein
MRRRPGPRDFLLGAVAEGIRRCVIRHTDAPDIDYARCAIHAYEHALHRENLVGRCLISLAGWLHELRSDKNR